MNAVIPQNALVLYKNRPARVRQTGEKLEIELEDGESLKVRHKDVVLLHPGPLHSLNELNPRTGEIETAWELLAGSSASLPELAELIFGAFTPATAWSTWELVADGLYFHGDPELITAHTEEEVEHERQARREREEQQQKWQAFLAGIRRGKYSSQDAEYLREVEDLALKRRDSSRVMRDLGRAERPENAHAFLLEIGYWDYTLNPYPARLGAPVSQPQVELPDLPDENRLDLTHLPAFAIDDEGNQEPDDALSLDGERVWVHVADVAALVPPGSPADGEAIARGATLYLPEGPARMLPPEAVQRLGLGMREVSPALSFGIDLQPDGQIAGLEIAPSWVRVQRLSYAQAEGQLGEPPFNRLYDLARLYHKRRLQNGAVTIDLPEVKIHVEEGIVFVRPILPMESRSMVREAMLMAGEAAARYAVEHKIPAAFVTQPGAKDALTIPSQERDTSENKAGAVSFAAMFALRRAQNRSQVGSQPGPHAGLGLEAYMRVTSPLRRCLDLAAHQQLRAHALGAPVLTGQEMLERIGASEAVAGSVYQAESLSRRHWTLVYLLQNPEWQGEAVLVETRHTRGKFLIPDLAMEIQMALRRSLELDSRIKAAFKGANLPELEGYFRAV